MYSMLNLKIGRFYEIKCAVNIEHKYVCQACSKTVHGDRSHSYLVQYPNTQGSIHPFGIYLWDYGCANKGYKYWGVSSGNNPILECRELTDKETTDLVWQFVLAGQEMAVERISEKMKRSNANQKERLTPRQ